MNRATIGFYLAVVLGSCSMNGVSQADELLTWDDFFVADESRHQWVNEHNGRTGALNVKGAVHHTMLWKYGRAGQIGRFDNTSDGVPVSGKVAGRVREKT